MRKQIITRAQQDTVTPDQDWLNVEELVEVEITSEDEAHPIESALLLDRTSGWRASEPGKQIIRLLFNRPQRLRHIFLKFVENETVRTQEYTLSWSSDGQAFTEIVRQQWNFSPEGATSEAEDHHVDLAAVTVLQLSITPDISGRPVLASLAQLRLA